MTDLVDGLGVNVADNTEVFIALAIYTFAVVTIFWVIGMVQGNHSMMDGYYGFGFAIPPLAAYFIVDSQSQVALLVLLMALLHGCRLGWYLAKRWRTEYVPTYGGDPRYLNFSKELQPGYWWKSFFKVMEPQAVIIVLIGAPAVVGILLNQAPDGQLGVLAFVGLLVFMVGLYHESVGDGQLQAFMQDKPENQGPKGSGRYLNTGVWKHSRHPAYFGNTLVWWGIWIAAMDGNTDVWWTVAGPLINTLMLTSVLGSAFQDNYMGSRPEYRELMARTRKFLPIPLSKSRLAAQQAKLADAPAQEASEPEKTPA